MRSLSGFRVSMAAAVSCAVVASFVPATAVAAPAKTQEAAAAPQLATTATGSVAAAFTRVLTSAGGQSAAATAIAAVDPSTPPAPSQAAAQARAAETGVRVEDLSARSETSQTFANPDGSLTKEQATAPVRTKTADGGWADIDPTLVKQSDGSYAPKVFANPVRVGGGGSSLIAEVGQDDGASVQMRWPATLPAPSVSGGVATYRLSERMDVLAVVVGGGISVRVQFNAVPTAAERALALSLDSQGLAVTKTTDDLLEVTNAKKQVVSSSSGLTAWDTRRDGAGDPLKTVPISGQLKAVSGTALRGDQRLSLQLPDSFLDDPSTQYPVTIDPDVTVNPYPGIDTYVRQTEDYSHGSKYALDIGRNQIQDADYPARSFLAFGSVGGEVEKATLRLWQYSTGTCAARPFYAQPVASGWTEAITTKNEPGVKTDDDSLRTASSAQPCDPGAEAHGVGTPESTGPVSIDMTNLAAAWQTKAIANYGVRLAISSAQANDYSYERRFCSSELDTQHDWCTQASKFPVLSTTFWQDPPNEKIGAGNPGFYQFETEKLTDKMDASVNVGNGNLLVSATDANVSGTAGLDLGLTRYYNSVAAAQPGRDNSRLGPGWSDSLGGSVRLEFPDSDNNHVFFYGPSGYRQEFKKNGSNYDRIAPSGQAKLTQPGGSGPFKIRMRDKTSFWFEPYSGQHEIRGRLRMMSDKNDNQLTYTYKTLGYDQVLSYVTDTQGRKAVMAYDANGMLSAIEIQDPSNQQLMRYAYTYANGRLASSSISGVGTGTLGDVGNSEDLNKATTYSYDSTGRLVKIVDARENADSNGKSGGTTTISYDASGKVSAMTRVTDDDNVADSTRTFAYDPNTSDTRCSNTDSRTKVDGPRPASDVDDTMVYCADTNARVKKTVDSFGHVRAKTYDANSNVATADTTGTGAGGTADTFQMDHGDSNTDQPTKVSAPSNNTPSSTETKPSEEASYGDTSSPDFPTSMSDFDTNDGSQKRSHTWDFDYDDDGNLIDATAKMTNDKTKAEDPNKKVTYRYCWTGSGQLQRIDPIDSAGNNSVTKDEQTARTDTGCGTADQGNDTILTYNAQGNLAKVDPPGDDGTQTMTYDPLSRVRTMTDGRGVKTTYSYDLYGRTVREEFDTSNAASGITGPSSPTVQWTYDRDGNLTKLEDSNGSSETFSFDELNRRVSQSRNGDKTKTYTYDPVGNVTSFKVDGDPDATTYTYNANNQVLSVDDPRSSHDVVRFAYDRHDQKTKTVYPMADGNDLVQRAKYNDGGLVTCMYSYRINNTSFDASDDAKCPDATASGLITFRKYDYTKTVSVLGQTVNVPTRTRYHSTDKGQVVTDYDYDAISRLTGASTTMNGNGLRTFTYDYDRHSNLISDHTTGQTPGLGTGWTYFGYAANDELCATVTGPSERSDFSSCDTKPADATSYSYDGLGALAASSKGLKLDYNAIGQTAGATAPGDSSSTPMSYTGVTQDHRISSGDTSMSYGFSGDVTSQTQGGALGSTTWFVRDPQGTLISMVGSTVGGTTSARYYLADAQNSVLATLDANTGTATRYLYEPYGQQIRTWIDATPANNTSTGGTPPDGSETTPASNTADPNPWRYASGYQDPATGFLKYGTRYYMPNIGRWTQTDPQAGTPSSPITENRYVYAGSDPANKTDPAGRSIGSDLFGKFSDAFDIVSIGEDIAEGDAGAAFNDILAFGTGFTTSALCEISTAGETGGLSTGLCVAAGAEVGALTGDILDRTDPGGELYGHPY